MFDLARDHDWNDRIEKPYRSIEDGLEKSWHAGYRVVCDMDDDLSLIENMSRALQVFTIADGVWNEERDASAAQALLLKIDDGCAKVREAQSKLGDLLYPWDRVREHLRHAAEVDGGAA